MKIIFDARGDDVESHARNIVRKVNAKNDSPKDIASHAAQVPSVCEDCGSTYWHRDDEYMYFPHVGCKGGQKNAGF